MKRLEILYCCKYFYYTPLAMNLKYLISKLSDFDGEMNIAIKDEGWLHDVDSIEMVKVSIMPDKVPEWVTIVKPNTRIVSLSYHK